MKQVFLFILGTMSIAQSIAQTEIPNIHQFKLDDCVVYAQKNNVQVKNALLAIDAQVQTNREIGAAAYPTIMSSLQV